MARILLRRVSLTLLTAYQKLVVSSPSLEHQKGTWRLHTYFWRIFSKQVFGVRLSHLLLTGAAPFFGLPPILTGLPLALAIICFAVSALYFYIEQVESQRNSDLNLLELVPEKCSKTNFISYLLDKFPVLIVRSKFWIFSEVFRPFPICCEHFSRLAILSSISNVIAVLICCSFKKRTRMEKCLPWELSSLVQIWVYWYWLFLFPQWLFQLFQFFISWYVVIIACANRHVCVRVPMNVLWCGDVISVDFYTGENNACGKH